MFFSIAANVVFPIFLVMAFGFVLAKRFSLDLNVLSKLNFYVFIPVFMFYSLLVFRPTGAEMSQTVWFDTLLAFVTLGVMALVTRLSGFTPSQSAAAALSVVVFNSANYGIPVVQLAFQSYGVSVQVITITVMNVITYTLGILIVGGWNEWRKGLRTILALPILYTLAAALAVRALGLTLPDPILFPLRWISDGMLPVALLTLGAQLGQGGLSLKDPAKVWVTVACRLLLGPLLAYALLKLLGLQGPLAQVLFVSSAFPTAVATVLFSIEYKKEPTFTADVVFLTTLLSVVTVTAAIKLSSTLF